MTTLLVLTLLVAPEHFAKLEGSIQLDEPGNLLDVRDVKRGEPAPFDGCWAPNETCAHLMQARTEWREEARSYREKRRFGILVALLVGLVLGMLLKRAPSGRSR